VKRSFLRRGLSAVLKQLELIDGFCRLLHAQLYPDSKRVDLGDSLAQGDEPAGVEQGPGSLSAVCST
jgi:hypothetical protein